ncbi:MAG: integrase arm-type DNA-binding domain-containing protein, partial [Mariprofundus sp.]|nr:integrase arm-type DNA-binding domain-containing protein [Mariprofundus sp.]
MALSDAAVKAAKLSNDKKQLKLTDGAGLYLLVTKSGKYWRLDYRFDGKRETLALGTHPDVPLAGRVDKSGQFHKGARDLRGEAKQRIKQGIDPSLKKQSDRREQVAEQAKQKAEQVAESNTFELLAIEWHQVHRTRWSDKHATTILRRFELHVFPMIGAIPLIQMAKGDVAKVLIEQVKQGKLEMGKRVGQITKQVLEYACDKGVIDAIPMG